MKENKKMKTVKKNKATNKPSKEEDLIVTIRANRAIHPPPMRFIKTLIIIMLSNSIIVISGYHHPIFGFISLICFIVLLYIGILTAMLNHRTRNLFLFLLSHFTITLIVLAIFPIIGPNRYEIIRISMSLLLLYIIVLFSVRMFSNEITRNKIDNKFEAYFLHHYSNKIDIINFHGFFAAGSNYDKYMILITEYAKVKTITSISKSFLTAIPIAVFIQFALATQYFIIEGVKSEILTNLLILTNVYAMISVIAYYFYHRYLSEERLLSEMIDEQINVFK